MTEQEKKDALLKLGKEISDKIAALTGKKEPTQEGVIQADAIGKDEFEKMKTDFLDVIERKIPTQKKMVFGGKKELKENEERIPFGKYLLMVKSHHPIISDMYMKTVMSEGDAAQGGYLVPTEYSGEILGELNDEATIVPKCTQLTQSAPTKNIPKWLNDLTIYWVSEAAVKTPSKPTLTRIQSVLKKMCAIVTATDEELQDEISSEGLPNSLERLTGENMALEIERIVLVGDTNLGDAFSGIYASVTGGNSINQLGANFQYQDIQNVWNNASVLEKYRRNPEWYMNRTGLGLIMALVDGNNRPLVNVVNAFDQKDPHRATVVIFGDKVNLSSQIPNTLGTGSACTTIIYGDYRYVIIGKKKGYEELMVDVNNQGIISSSTSVSENLWQQNETGFRFDLRRGVVVGIVKAYSVLKNMK